MDYSNHYLRFRKRKGPGEAIVRISSDGKLSYLLANTLDSALLGVSSSPGKLSIPLATLDEYRVESLNETTAMALKSEADRRKSLK